MSKRTQYEQPVELKEAEPRFVYWQRNWRINTERAHRPGAATRLHQAEAAHAGSYSDRQARISRQRGAKVRIWEAWGDPPDPAGLGFRRRSPTDAISLASVKKPFIAAPIISSMLVAFGGDVINSLLIFFVLFLSRVVLRKEWIAVVATIAIVAGIDYAPGGMRFADLPFEISLVGILTVVMLWFGLIAAIFGYATKSILRLPHTLDFSAWYAGTTAVPLILLALLALYGFRASLGGRRLIELPD